MTMPSPRRAAVLLASALVLAAAPAWGQDKIAPLEARAAHLHDLAERAYALNMADDHAAAEPVLREVIDGWRALGWGDAEATRATVLLWAWSLIELGRFDVAETELTTLAAAPSITGPHAVSAWGLLAKLYSRSGRFTLSEEAAVQALAQAEAAYGQAHAETAAAWHNLGTARGEIGQNAEAIDALRHATALYEQLFGPAAEPTLASIYNLAAHLHARGDPAAAELLLRRVLESAAPGSESRAYALHHLGFTLTVLNRPEEAEPYLRQAVDLRASLPDPHLYAVSLSALANALDGEGRHEEAEAEHRRAISVLQDAWRSGYEMTLSAALLTFAENQQALGRAQAAETAYRRSIEIARGSVAPGHPRLTLRALGLAAFLNDDHRPVEALALLRPMAVALLDRAHDLDGGDARREVDPFRSLFRETVQAAWLAAQPIDGPAR